MNGKTGRDIFAVRLQFRHWKKLLPYLKQSRWQLFGAVALIPLAALFRMSLPRVIKETVDQLIEFEQKSAALTGGLLFLGLTIGEYLAKSGQRIAAGVTVQRLVAALRLDLIKHLVYLPAVFHDKQNSGVITTRATGDFNTLQNSLQQGILGSLVDVVAIFGSLAGVFLLDWRIGLILSGVLFLLIPMIKLFSYLLRTTLHKARNRMGELSGFALECFYNFSAVKALSGEKSGINQFNRINRRFRNIRIGNVLIDALLYSLIEGISAAVIGGLLWLTVFKWNYGELSPGLLIALVAYIQQIFEPLKELSNKIAQLQGASTVLERIFGLFEHQENLSGNTVPQKQLQGKLLFQDVSFAYRDGNDGTGAAVLKGINFELDPGSSLAVVGRTGSGKTTLLRLLLREYDGYNGSIHLDGCELSRYQPHALRARLGIVPQETVIFRGTIEFNLTLGNPAVTEEMMIAAAKETGADRFIQKLPGGYAYPVHSGGNNLSQGQRQLLAFTRALAAEPELLVLDEATSSVDPASEQMVQRSIERILKGRTVLIVAHRLSTVKHCDMILVLDDGAVVERGNHKELLAMNGIYASMVSSGDLDRN